MIGTRQLSEQEQGTQSALWRGVMLVFFPGLLLVIGFILLVIPSRPPIPSLNGCYRLVGLPLIRISPGFISVEGDGISPIPMKVENGKEGYVINAMTGFSFRTGEQGKQQAFKDYPQGELIPVFISKSQPPSLGLLSDGEQVKTPKVDCPR